MFYLLQKSLGLLAFPPAFTKTKLLSRNWSNTYSTTSQMWYPRPSPQHSGDRDEYSLLQASPGCIVRPSLETKIHHWAGNMNISSLQQHDSEQQKWVTWTQPKDSFLAIVVNVWLFKWLDLIQIWSSFPFKVGLSQSKQVFPLSLPYSCRLLCGEKCYEWSEIAKRRLWKGNITQVGAFSASFLFQGQ